MLLTFSALSLVNFFLIRLSCILHILNIYILGISAALSSLSSLDCLGVFCCFFSIESCIKFKLWRKATSPLWMEDKRLITAANFFDVHFKKQWERPGALEDLIIH